MGMPDSILLSSLVDGTVLVVKAGQTQKNALSETKRIFGTVNAKTFRGVLNGVKNKTWNMIIIRIIIRPISMNRNFIFWS